MSSLFSSPHIPDMPPPVPTPPPPTIDSAAQTQDQQDLLRRRLGRASTVLVPGGSQPLGGSMPAGYSGGVSGLLG